MKRSYNFDIILVILLAIISLVCISTPSLNKFNAVIIPYVLLLFVLPGYSILTALSTKKRGSIRKIITGILISVVILFLFELSLNYTKISFEILLLSLTVLTVFFAEVGYIRRLRTSKKPKSKYIICESCGGYYKLEEGESLDDFEACRCGGELKYAENNFMSKQESPKRKEVSDNKENTKKSKTITSKYIVCKNCGGFYKLKERESLDDFKACHCGGELKYAENNFRPETLKNLSKSSKIIDFGALENVKLTKNSVFRAFKSKAFDVCGTPFRNREKFHFSHAPNISCSRAPKSRFREHFLKFYRFSSESKKGSRSKIRPNSFLFIIILSLLAIIAVNIPSISSSIIKLIIILPLLFFLPGYSLTKAMYHHLSRFKLLLSGFILSISITFLLCLMFSNFVKVPQKTFILILASLTIILTIISYIRLLKLSKATKKYPKLHESHSKTIKIKERKFTLPDKDSISTLPDKSLKFLPSDIVLVWLITVLCVVFVLTPNLNDTVFRIILGLLLILFAPGYSLIAALFPKKDDLDGIERIALSFGLSIAVTPLIGLLLNYTPFGIRLEPILISLSIFTIFMSVVAYIRRWKLYEDERFSVNFKHYFSKAVESFKKESGKDRILSILLVISIILAISATIYVIATPKEGEKFTEFYMLGPNGKASDYPTNLTVGETGTVTIGVINHEYASVNYKMVVKLNNQTIDEKNITLSNNEKYEEPFTFVSFSSGQKQELEFLLYKLPDDKDVYRSLHLWLNVS